MNWQIQGWPTLEIFIWRKLAPPYVLDYSAAGYSLASCVIPTPLTQMPTAEQVPGTYSLVSVSV
jgi:hypothetical protein